MVLICAFVLISTIFYKVLQESESEIVGNKNFTFGKKTVIRIFLNCRRSRLPSKNFGTIG